MSECLKQAGPIRRGLRAGARGIRRLAMVGSGGEAWRCSGPHPADGGVAGALRMMVQAFGPQIRGGESAAWSGIARERSVLRRRSERRPALLPDIGPEALQGTVHLHPRSILILERSTTERFPSAGTLRSARPTGIPSPPWRTEIEVVGDPRTCRGLRDSLRMLGWPPDLAPPPRSSSASRARPALERNLKAFDRGWAAERRAGRCPESRGMAILCTSNRERGDRARAIEAGLRFFAGYPITPSSEVMETLIDELPAQAARWCRPRTRWPPWASWSGRASGERRP